MTYAKIPPQVLQIEHHPYLTQEPLIKLCNTLGIAVTAYSSFGPASFIELDMDKKVKSLFSDDNSIKKIASSHNKSEPNSRAYLIRYSCILSIATAQVLLRWATQRNIAVIPKSNKLNRLLENFHCIDFNLSEEEIKEISSLNQNIRFNDPADIDPRMAIFA